MSDRKRVLITGATGKQGGATVRHLLRRGGFELRALTRNPASAAAQALGSQGVEVVQGDQDDSASLARALAGVWGVFAVQNTWEAGVVKEEEQGKRLVSLAREVGVRHFVYTSVGSADRGTGIPHFENKWRIEGALRAAQFSSYAILRPVFFMENLLTPWFLNEDRLVTAMLPETRLQMIGADDIGKFAASALAEPEKWNRCEVEIAGDALTMPQAAQLVSGIIGRPVRFEQIPIEAVRQNSEDFALMLEWFDRVGYSAEISRLETNWGIRPMTAAEWATTQRR
jgi:uncharacterized protein YbjT (DUF2867 family)